MEASQYIRELSLQLKQYLKHCEEMGEFCAEKAQKTVINGLAPLAQISQENTRTSDRSHFINRNTVEDPYIYLLILEYLCRQNAVHCAKMLFEEIEEMFPSDEELESIFIPKEYSPWADELGINTTRVITRRSLSAQRMAEIKVKCRSVIKTHKEIDRGADAFSVLYRIVEKTLKDLDTEVKTCNSRVALLQQCVNKIKRCFREEHDSLLYFDGRQGHIYAKHSKDYRDLQMILSLLVVKKHQPEVERLINVKKAYVPKDEISLETFYYVGKKMESINMAPYNSEGEVESAVPPLLSFHSTFFCPILRTECSVDNVPCILTCGHIISIRALEKIAAYKGVVFKCPYCPKDINIKDVFKAKLYI